MPDALNGLSASRMRAELKRAWQQLIDTEAELADQLTEIRAFEARAEARLGSLIDRVEQLEAEIAALNDQIRALREERLFGRERVFTRRQTRRTWDRPQAGVDPKPPARPDSAKEAEIKQVYRQLALRWHPDLGRDASDRAARTQMMAKINTAYGKRDLGALLAMAEAPPGSAAQAPAPERTEAGSIAGLRDALARCQRRLREVEAQLKSLHGHPSVLLSLDVKLAAAEGRDLLSEMASDLRSEVERKIAEREFLRSQLERSRGGDPRFGESSG